VDAIRRRLRRQNPRTILNQPLWLPFSGAIELLLEKSRSHLKKEEPYKLDITLLPILIVFFSGLVAGVINTLAGGGSLLTLPILLFVGLPAPIANGTNRVAIWIQCVAAVVSFQKRGIPCARPGIRLSLPAIVGAILGAQWSLQIPEDAFRKILAVIMLIVIGLVVWNPNPKPIGSYSPSMVRKIFTALVFFLIGLYGGFLQVGVGFMFTAVLTLLCGFDLVTTAGVKVFVIAVYTLFALLVFLYHGQVDWSVALVLSLGNGIGGWIGGRIAVEKGETWLRVILAVSVVAMAFKLLGVFPF